MEHEPMTKIKVLLADDHALVRQGLRKLLETEPDITVVGEAETGWQALQWAKERSPDVVVMDLAMPSLNGMDATRLILKEAPQTRVLVLSSYSEDEYVHQMTEAGAAGYLLKQTAATELIKGIREVMKGNVFFCSAILERISQNLRQALMREMPEVKGLRQLSPRELEIVQLIAEGKANMEIAPQLRISIKTVEKHRQAAMNKLNIHNVAGLTRYAISKGMIMAGIGSAGPAGYSRSPRHPCHAPNPRAGCGSLGAATRRRQAAA
jgi:DNA-binding NarL/FixJ family response regulator